MINRARACWRLGLPLALTLLLSGAPTPAPAQGGKVALNLVSWSYGVEIVRDNIAKFQQRYPGVTVNYSDFSWGTYHDAMVARFVAHGVTKFVLVPAGPPDSWDDELAWLAPVVRAIESGS